MKHRMDLWRDVQRAEARQRARREEAIQAIKTKPGLSREMTDLLLYVMFGALLVATFFI